MSIDTVESMNSRNTVVIELVVAPATNRYIAYFGPGCGICGEGSTPWEAMHNFVDTFQSLVERDKEE